MMTRNLPRTAIVLLAGLLLAGCALFSPRDAAPEVDIASAVSGADGLARVESARGVIDFQVSSGLSGERLGGIRIRVATWGETRMVFAEDPAGEYFAAAAPLAGDATVRRLVMPPRAATGYNITGADGAFNMADLTALGTLNEEGLRLHLTRGPDEAVLIYLYNPMQPLALTGADLEAFATPFEGVTVLRAPGEPPEAQLGMVLVSLGYDLFNAWEHREIDRYLATRIGQRPPTDLRGDLAFQWSYPVFEVLPAGDTLALDENGQVIVTVAWRSPNPNPPPPWSVFLTSDQEEAVTIAPESVLLSPEAPSQDFTVTVNQELLPPGQHSVQLFVQPYSETFGLIEQAVTRALAFEVAERAPTPTPGPQLDSLTTSPAEPREGDMLIITAAGFTPREAVLVELTGREFSYRDALAVANDEGAFNYIIDLTTVPGGSYTLRLTGTASEISGEAAVDIEQKVADAIVDRPELNMRLGPGSEHPVVEVLVQGDELTVIAVNWDDSWLEVRTATGQTGWVMTSLLDVNVDLSTVPWNSNWPNPNP